MVDSTSTQVRLTLLVALAFMPAVGLYFYAARMLEERELRAHEQELLQFAHVAGVEYQRLLIESRQLLAGLAEFPEIRNGRQPDCNQRLSSVLRHTPQYTTLSLIGVDGYLACGSLTVDGGLYLGDRAYYRLATVTQRFSVGNYAVGRITGKPTVGVAYPILSDDGTDVESVLAVSLDLSTLGVNALRMRIPEGATFSVVDRNRTVMVRVPEGLHPLGYDTIGASAPETFPDLQDSAAEPYILIGVDLDGVRRRFAVAPLRGEEPRPDGHLLVGLEEYTLLADVEEIVATELRFLMVAGVVVLVVAWIFGHYALARPAEMGVAEAAA